MGLKFKVIIAVLIVSAIGGGLVYANVGNPRIAVEFFKGHTHDEGQTFGAPSHSGGLDRNGCHNGSVPYHCH
jgi:hypothetical protein